MPTSPAEGAPGRPAPYLEATGIAAGYGATVVVSDVSVSVGKGEIATIIGPNGSGKSTLLKALTGELEIRQGRLEMGGTDVTRRRRDQLVKAGLRLVPQEKVVFNGLTVRENLELGGYLLKRSQVPGAVERVLSVFPLLAPLQKAVAGRLSGGERKLVAIGRVLMSDPEVVVLDEPSASLSPAVSQTFLATHMPALAESGAAVLLVEQRAVQALQHSDWAYLMIAGRVELSAPAAELLARGDIGHLFLGQKPTQREGAVATEPADAGDGITSGGARAAARNVGDTSSS